ncbi:hypothetical protein [Limnobacter parvus]|uniref:LPS export ABC transporter periplasmic protein LptC n=1 Tax=Limnobacter parvus TaxID=2939690 RepID=A0ABT1XE10_9BURK|nr:hypothetical protein [Limnobacter parvus]MCR2745485.1 hypothetical protein [Limnobacter parvus]
MRLILRPIQQISLAACTALLVACSPPAPDSLEKMANGNIVEVQGLNSDTITFVTRNRMVSLFATDAYNIMREMKRYYPQEFNSHPTLSVQAVTELQNQQGEVFNNQPLFTVHWRRPDLNQMDLDSKFSLNTEEILLYADRVESHSLIGDQILIEHCTVTGDGEKRIRFCDQVIDGLFNK